MPTTHTPGPWEYDDTRAYYAKPVIRHNGLVVASIGNVSMKKEEHEANARLIAAAPALYKSLKQALCVLEIHYQDRLDRGELPESVEVSRAALAQADGKEQP